MADWAGIKAAIAAQCANATGVVEATSTELQGVSDYPCVKVTHITSVEVTGRPQASVVERHATIMGKLLVAKSGDLGDALTSVETIAEAISVACDTGILLGFPGRVQDYQLLKWEAGDVEYGGQEWSGAILTWEALVRENDRSRSA